MGYDLSDERLIDFTECHERTGGYPGANGRKISIEFNDHVYMLKFPAIAKINHNMHYTNGCLSEYLGCHIYNLLGIPVQHTILGKYRVAESDYLVVACRDFTFVDSLNTPVEIQDFISTKNTVIDTPGSGKGTDLQNVITAINMQTKMDPDIVMKRFWDMFIVDAFIGNWDRHNGNWGMLYDKSNDTIIGLAPVFDCGSSLYPQADEEIMKSVLEDENQLKIRIYERPMSALTLGDKKINYFDFMMSSTDNDFLNAVERIIPRIDMNEINRLIDDTPGIDSLRKDFYHTVLTARKELILDKALERAKDLNRSIDNEEIFISRRKSSR